MNNIKNTIGWADWSWNPITGCSPVSEGCEHCYAAAMSKRFGLPWGTPVFKPERLAEPLKLKKPARIFVSSMSDMFHQHVLFSWRDEIFNVIKHTEHHTYIILTKRPQHLIYEYCAIKELPNLWIGVSIENQQRANERIPELLKIPAAKHIVSVEPMLGPVDLTYAAFNGADSLSSIEGIDWVIAGPETGAGKRPCADWMIYELFKQCANARIPFYDKRKYYIQREWPV